MYLIHHYMLYIYRHIIDTRHDFFWRRYIFAWYWNISFLSLNKTIEVWGLQWILSSRASWCESRLMRITVLDMGKPTDWFWWYRIQLFDHGDGGTMNRGWYLILEPTHVGGMTIAYIPWFDHGTYYYGKKTQIFYCLHSITSFVA